MASFKARAFVPLVVIDMIGGDHSAGEVGALATMHVHRPGVITFQDAEDLGNFGLGRGRKPVHRHIDGLNAGLRNYCPWRITKHVDSEDLFGGLIFSTIAM
jgi:hypothetical protein